MALPGRLVGKVLGGMRGQLGDDWPGQCAGAHVGKRLGVDHVIRVTRPEQFEEVEPALRRGRAEPGEMIIADLGADLVCAPVTPARPARPFLSMPYNGAAERG